MIYAAAPPRWRIDVTAEPSEEPVTVEEAKAHLRVESSDDDALIARLITAARRQLEQSVSRAFVRQSLSFLLDCFPVWEWRFPRQPIISVESIKYIDDQGVLTTLSAAEWHATLGETARVSPAYGYTWPTPRAENDAVRIAVVAGYGAASAVPAEAKQWILMAVGGLYRFREPAVIGTIGMLDAPAGLLNSLYWGAST